MSKKLHFDPLWSFLTTQHFGMPKAHGSGDFIIPVTATAQSVRFFAPPTRRKTDAKLTHDPFTAHKKGDRQ
jgi:hypothetical protein